MSNRLKLCFNEACSNILVRSIYFLVNQLYEEQTSEVKFRCLEFQLSYDNCIAML